MILLGIGDTYPLTDLNVVADQLKVPYGGTAKIPIEDAQEVHRQGNPGRQVQGRRPRCDPGD